MENNRLEELLDSLAESMSYGMALASTRGDVGEILMGFLFVKDGHLKDISAASKPGVELDVALADWRNAVRNPQDVDVGIHWYMYRNGDDVWSLHTHNVGRSDEGRSWEVDYRQGTAKSIPRPTTWRSADGDRRAGGCLNVDGLDRIILKHLPTVKAEMLLTAFLSLEEGNVT